MTNKLFLQLVLKLAPVALGALGAYLATNFPAVHSAVCAAGF